MLSRPALVCCVLMILACKPAPNQASEVKSGRLGTASTYWLTNYPSGSALSLYGASPQTVAWAINVWAAPLGKSFVVQSGTSPSQATVWSYSQRDAESRGWCNGFAGRAYALPDRTPMVIVDCGGFARSGSSYVLHEVGHLFGLCDQYPEGISNCAVSTQPAPGSVMYSARTTSLTDDDVTGVMAVATFLGGTGGGQGDGGLSLDDQPTDDGDPIADDVPPVDGSVFADPPADTADGW